MFLQIISGRGTEEIKTNEVAGRFRLGEVGIGVEVGRPVTGASFKDLQKIAQAVAAFGVRFETCNPTTSLMSDSSTGKFKEELLNEKVLSAILEFSVIETTFLKNISLDSSGACKFEMMKPSIV